MESRRTNPHVYTGSDVNERDAWNNGYKAAEYNRTIERIGTTYQQGVAAGRELERDVIGEQLILMAQEYGHAQFVFTRETLEELQGQTSEIVSTLADIETLR